MKKIFALIICVLLLFSLSACKKDNPQPVTENNSSTSVIGGADEPTDIVVTEEEKPQTEAPVSGNELIEKVEKLEEIQDPEEREALLAEIQTILEQAENAAK